MANPSQVEGINSYEEFVEQIGTIRPGKFLAEKYLLIDYKYTKRNTMSHIHEKRRFSMM